MNGGASLGPAWVAERGELIAAHFERELEALVAVSTPSGDVAAAEEICALMLALLPDEATVERPPCSTPGFAPDLLGDAHGNRHPPPPAPRPPRHRRRPR